MIPKIIHYCWFGGNPLPEDAKKCIASWKKFCPEYEIKEWNESNFDLNACDYIKEAYAAKKWAFVSDYARFAILYQYGGLYFDTDVEIIRPIDDLIQKGPFMGLEKDAASQANPGLGLAAAPGLGLYKELIDIYHQEHFVNAQRASEQKTVVQYTTELLVRKGLRQTPGIQCIDGIYIYPKEYFNPYDHNSGKIEITENTRSIHHYAASWCDHASVRRGKIYKKLYKIAPPSGKFGKNHLPNHEQKVKYSIIVPVYNIYNYLSICVESILYQSYIDFELILVDDGSTDDSGKLCDIYAQKDVRVKVIHHDNQGVSAARNIGTSRAIGKYLIFLDGDDHWTSNKALYDIDRKINDADIAVWDYKRVPDGEDENDIKAAGSVLNLAGEFSSGVDYLDLALTSAPEYLWYPWKYAFKRELWIRNTLSFPVGVKVHEDLATIYKAFLPANKVIVLDQCIYAYRVGRNSSASGSDTLKLLCDRIEVNSAQIDYILSQNMLSEKLKKLLCKNMAMGYYAALIRSTALHEATERTYLWAVLRNSYAKFSKYPATGKQKFANLMIAIMGIKKTAYILGVRRKVKAFLNR